MEDNIKMDIGNRVIGLGIVNSIYLAQVETGVRFM
jgi:hypothetical protein